MTRIPGTNGADALFGTSLDDKILGFAGDDTIESGDGNDTVFTGAGNDVVYGGSGDDVLAGNDGDDTLFGGGGVDRLLGGQGHDVMVIDVALPTAPGQRNVLYGGDGVDTVVLRMTSEQLSDPDVYSDIKDMLMLLESDQSYTYATFNALGVRLNSVEAMQLYVDGEPVSFGGGNARIVINEIMQNPAATSDAEGEWFELFNDGTTAVDIAGWAVSDRDSDSFTIDNSAPLIIPPGGYLVLGRNGDTATNGGVAVDYEYGSGFALANGADEIILTDVFGNVIDEVDYDGGPTFPDPTGASMELADAALDNNVGAHWLTAESSFGDGDLGTPGAANTVELAMAEIIVTEIMQNPDAVFDSAGEWFEIYNAGADAVDLEGWTIADEDSETTTITGSLVIGAGEYLVLGRNGDSAVNGGVDVDYVYSGFNLANGADEVILSDTYGRIVDYVAYDGGVTFPDPTGASMILLDVLLDNALGASWTTSTESFGDGDFGTPGEANVSPPATGGLLFSETFDYAEDGAAAAFTVSDSTGAASFFAESSSFDYFGIFDGDGDGGADFGTDSTPASFNAYIGADDNYLGTSDLDGGTPSITEPAYLTWSGIDISGLSELVVSADLASLLDSAALDASDFVTFEVRVDGGSWSPVLSFETGDSTSFNNDPFLQDTDFDGVGDGDAVSETFQPFSQGFSVSGTSLELRVAISVNAGFEDIALDNVTLSTPEATLPQIAEFESNPAGADPAVQSFEISGKAGASFSGWLISIEADGSFGTVDRASEVSGTFDANGLLVVEVPDLENPSFTVALTSDYNGTADIDGDDDGVIDDAATTFGTVYDAIGIADSTGDEAFLLGDALGGTDFAYTGAEPQRVFRDGTTGELFAVNTLGTSTEVSRTDGSTVSAGAFDSDPASATNFGSLNEHLTGDDGGTGNGFDITLISEIQGAGEVSPYDGQTVTVEAIVTQVTNTGFYMQEETDDLDDLTSEGIFVYTGSGEATTIGDLVQVTGLVDEFFGLTEITSVSGITTMSSGNPLPEAVVLALSPDTALPFERYEGMLVEIVSGVTDTDLTVLANFNLDRYGELLIGTGNQTQPTQIYDAQTEAAEVAALAEANANASIILQDNTSSQNPDQFEYISGGAGDDGNGYLDRGDDFSDTGSTVRLGAEVEGGVTGVITYEFDDWRLSVTETVTFDESTNVGARQATPEDVGGDLQVASYNVLNFFTTIDEPGAGTGPDGTLDPRGADTTAEFDRQASKIAQGIIGTGAEVLALQEIENNGTGAGSAIATLTDILDGMGTGADYEWVDPTGTGDFIGTDAITTGIIYDANEVTLIHSEALIYEEDSAAVTYALAKVLQDNLAINNDSGTSNDFELGDFDRNRPSVAATFAYLEDTGAVSSFTVVSSHFKSKGASSLDRLVSLAQAEVDAVTNTGYDQSDIDALMADANYDQGDGQGFWNGVRLDAATELTEWMANTYNDGGSQNVLFLGDMNAYAEEDPVQYMDDDAGLTDLIDTFIGQDEAYSYVFDGQRGALDQGFADASMAALVTDVTEWHINADEPDLIGYDSSFTDPAFYNPGIYASSDHDPLIIGIDFPEIFNAT